jgi:hypothetical protein
MRSRRWVWWVMIGAMLVAGSPSAWAKKRKGAAAMAMKRNAAAAVAMKRKAAAAHPPTARPTEVRRPGDYRDLSPTGTGGGATARSQVPDNTGKSSAREVVQRESRIEFDERLVQGQTASGAVYLFQRGEAEFHSMVNVPTAFRDRTVRQLYPSPQKR